MAKKINKTDALLESTNKGAKLVNISARIPAETLSRFNANNEQLQAQFGQRMPLKRVLEAAINEAIDLQEDKLDKASSPYKRVEAVVQEDGSMEVKKL